MTRLVVILVLTGLLFEERCKPTTAQELEHCQNLLRACHCQSDAPTYTRDVM